MTPAKRLLDVTASAAGLFLLWPVFALVAIAIKRDGGPVFFRQVRVGRHGNTFRMWKFRTMAVSSGATGPMLTVEGDPRITAVGRWLRRTKIDELPQLLNVVVGEMSLVGPRPEVPHYVNLYPPECRAVLELVPGITDPASIHYADESRVLREVADPERHYIEVLMPDKIQRNLAYAGNSVCRERRRRDPAHAACGIHTAHAVSGYAFDAAVYE